jgi:hypothetical protein
VYSHPWFDVFTAFWHAKFVSVMWCNEFNYYVIY